MTPDEMTRRILALERRVPSGLGVSTAFGATEVRPYQTGFPAELTSEFDTLTGYEWKQLVLLREAASTSVTDGTGPKTGAYAFTPDNNQELKSGTRGWLETDPAAGGFLFTPSGSAASTSCAQINAGLDTDDCLKLTVLLASGRCSGIDTTQIVVLQWDGVDSRWESLNDFTGTGSGGSGAVNFSFVNGYPYLTIDGVYGTPWGCDGGGLVFAFGGSVLCGGTDSECTNYFLVKLECHCCPPTGWAGEGWYCVSTTTCGTGNACVDYTETVPCTGDVVICSGPYADESTCEGTCGTGETGEGGTATCCGRALAATLYLSLSGGHGTATLVWDGSTYWSGSKTLSCGTVEFRFSTDCVLEYRCSADGGAFGVAPCVPDPPENPCTACGPPFMSGNYQFALGTTTNCSGCGTITGVVSE